MAWELEGLISHLLMLIASTGEKGCPVIQIINEIKGSSGLSGLRSRNAREPLSDHAVSIVWSWLVARSDVSVGSGREYNEMSLQKLLQLSSSSSDEHKPVEEEIAAFPNHTNAKSESTLKNPSSNYSFVINVFVSEDTMWELITGHSVNYKRVPGLEWILLLGIASTKSQGILQGDLGRLVGQDKRSVPKRTDSLLKKGYIVKRTTLVRGTKTSKLWLKFFAPPLTKESDNQNPKCQEEMNMTTQTLTANLDRVPWHTRWTGDSMDFHALATTIMAVTKEWHVIRLQDLKAKLGILGLRWQMKIASKICRFLNSCGAIQYVAAELDNKVYKDCIKFNRDLSSKDWSTFLATGKRSSKPMRTALSSMAERADPEWQVDTSSQVNGARLEECPPWAVDEPLPQKITRCAQSFGAVGITNPEIYALTLGPTFNRYLSSLTSCMVTSNVQPPELRHLQLKSEHIRVGKVASYRFFTPQVSHTLALADTEGCLEASQDSKYGFFSGPRKPRLSGPDFTFSSVCGLITLRGTGRNEAKQRGRPKRQPQFPSNLTESEALSPMLQPTKRVDELLITLRISTEALRGIMSPSKPVEDDSSPALQQLLQQDDQVETPLLSQPLDLCNSSDYINRPCSAHGRSRGRGRGRPTRSSSIVDVSSNRPWTCEKCGGSWKNDLGLKYHLEKSRTPCNPQFNVSMQETGRRAKCPTYFSRRIDETVNAETTEVFPGTKRSNLKSKARRVTAVSADQQAAAGTMDTKVTPAPVIGAVKSWNRKMTIFDEQVTFSPPKIGQGLLSPRATRVQAQGSMLRDLCHPAETGSIGNNLALRSSGHSLNSSESFPIFPAASLDTLDTSKAPDDAQLAGLNANQAAYQCQHHGASSKSDCVPIPRLGLKPPNSKTDNSHPELHLLIQRLLKEQHGVIIGGTPLWESTLALYKAEFIEKATPDKAQFQSTVNALLKDGIIVEHWHAFRDITGSFSKLQLLTSPGLDAFSAQSLKLLEKVKRAPASDGENKLDSDPNAGFSEVKIGRRGRRALAKEVATLRAPVYVAQVAAKKDQESETRDRVKRQRHCEAGDSIEEGASVLVKKQKMHQASSNSQPDFPRFQDELSQERRRTAPALRLQFLEPNHYLERDAPDLEFGQNLSSDEAQMTTQANHNQESTLPSGIPFDVSDGSDGGGGNDSRHGPMTVLYGCNGTWPSLDNQYFEHTDGSFTTRGWMPDAQWLEWEIFFQIFEKRFCHLEPLSGLVDDSEPERYRRFMDKIRACFEMEMSLPISSVNQTMRPAGPHSIFVRFDSGMVNMEAGPVEPVWAANGQLNPSSEELNSAATAYISSSTEDELDWPASSSAGNVHLHVHHAGHAETASHLKAKRVALVTRSLTSLDDCKVRTAVDDDVDQEAYPFDSPDELIAAFVAIRTLMGGADKSIDWGLLMFVFPNASLKRLRKFWDSCRKQKDAHISTLTRAVQERYLIAIERGDLPMINFDKPQDYDWARLIRWIVDIPRQEGFEIPRSRTLLDGRSRLADIKTTAEDWRQRFFHVQASVFARFEAATSAPAALSSDVSQRSSRANELDVAKSWVKSLCVTGDGKYSVKDIRDKFFTLMPGDKRMASLVFKQAIDELTKQRIICKSKRPPLGGRPYRLNEGYLAALGKLAQSAKYDDAARFKMKLDAVFRRQGKMTVPYSLSDGAMMALTNLGATERIRLVPTNLPHIPFGFEPGNYESRKYPKSYYHFGLEAVPTETYLFTDQIDVIRAACTYTPPLTGPYGELPQWVDIFGEPNETRWSEVLGAFCFAMTTRGSMDIRGVCSALQPTLDEFEARLIMRWGEQTGLFSPLTDGVGSPVNEWWWLVVPCLRRKPNKTR